MFLQLLSWYSLILVLGWLSFPLSFHLFKKLPDRGFTMSRILGLLVWGFIFWSLNVIGLLQNQAGGILFALIVLFLLNLWAGWGKWQEIWIWVQEHWRLILTAEAVFLLGFAFLILVRASNPDATGTEKPMELAFINAVIRSPSFPPHDPWLSGYAISYYHFGYILAGMLAKLTGVSGGIAFNLMLSITFAMSALGANGLLYNLLKSYHANFKDSFNALRWSLLGPIFLLFVSNLEAVLEVLHQAGVGWSLSDGTSRFWAWINIESLNVPPSPPITYAPQRFWWWWQASRVIQDIDLLGNVSGLSPIDEFPAFSYVLGDLHPHVLVMPFVMLLIGLAFAVFRGEMEGKTTVLGISLPYRWDMMLVSAVILGGIAFLNTWDLPVYLSLMIGAYFIRQVITNGWGWERLTELFKLVLPLIFLLLVLYLPFYISFQSQAGGILPNLVYPTRGLYLWLMFGTLFTPIFLLFALLWKQKYTRVWSWGAGLTGLLLLLLFLMSIFLGYRLAQTPIGEQFIAFQGKTGFFDLVSSALVHRLGYGFTLITLSVLLATGLAYLVGTLLKRDRDHQEISPVAFVLLMILLGGLMVLAPEFVYLQDSFGTRMNTIFKFYYQAWMLWSIAAAFASVVVLNKGAWVSKIIVVVIVLGGLIYPVLAYPNKTNQFRPAEGYTLDAAAYLERYQPQEAAALAWLSSAPYGVVAEAVGGQYSGYARVATISGQPTVLGWPGHEGQWRGGYEEVGSRETDIRTLYEIPNWDAALNIIRQYDIHYIYVGSLELSTYAINLEKFDNNLQTGFEQDGVRIYIVPENLINE